MPPRDETLTSRFELKYWLLPQQAAAVRQAIRPFVKLDRFSEASEDRRYTISSLYLDNPALDLYRSTIEGHRNRFKLRIRAYSDEPSDPVFVEIKKRCDRAVRKRRAGVPRETALALLGGRSIGQIDGTPDFDEFVQVTRRIGARPVMRVRYRREAYQSTGFDPLRITFDSELSYAVTPGSELGINGAGWESTPTEGEILEVKFTDVCPAWVVGMVRELGLDRCSIPKYVLCIERARSTVGGTPF